MAEMSTNIQQLPIVILEKIVSDLDTNEILVLVNVNRYLNLIVTPILYKDVLFYFDPADGYTEEVYKEVSHEVELATSEIKIDDQIDFETLLESNYNVFNELLEKKLDEIRWKQWSMLEPVIKKYRKVIGESKCINPNNLIDELENYNNLRRYNLNIDSQQCIEQLKRNKGYKLNLVEILQFKANYNIEYHTKDIFHSFVHLKGLEIDMVLLPNDFKRFSGFSNNTLTHLFFSNIGDLSIEFLNILNHNFTSLKHLQIKSFGIRWDSSLTELPIFENLLYFTFTCDDYIDSKGLSYLNNAKYWPKLRKLSTEYSFFIGTVAYEGQWNNLTTLEVGNIDPTNLNQWNNFNQLQVLRFHQHHQINSKTLQAIFTNLTNLTTLTLQGRILSQLFDFLSQIHLRKLHISNINNFSQPFVTFLKSLVTVRSLELCFVNNAFEDIDLNILLNENHKLLNLKYVNLNDLPQQLQQWFSYSLNN